MIRGNHQCRPTRPLALSPDRRQRLSSFANQQNRYCRAARDALRNAPQHQMLQPAAAMRSHDDEINARCPCFFHLIMISTG